MKQWLLSLPRNIKRILQLITDIGLIWFSIILAFIVRIGWEDTWLYLSDYDWLFIGAPIISLPIFIMMGMYRAVIRYVGKEALITIAKAVTLAALLLSVAIYWYDNAPKTVPRSLIFNYWWISLLAIGGLRLFIRHYFLGDWLDIFKHSLGVHKGRARVLVYGAGNAGKQLVSALRSGSHIEPIAFIDDDPNIKSANIDGLKVYAPNQVEIALKFPVRVRTIPGFIDLAKGKVKVQDLQEIDIADLLGRDPVEPHRDLFDFCIKDQVVMVTGAGGSIGSELCRQILLSRAKHLILFENSEYNLYKITRELQEEIKKEQLEIAFTPLLGSIQDQERLYNVMTKFKVDTIYHAAAYKHVPIVENNITQGVLNNVFGTYYTAEAAIRARVKNFVLISTDKAVRPTNVMGATKRLAEMVLQSFSKEKAITFLGDEDPTPNRTRITMVRFGNVLGSSGSVIPLFRKQIQEGNNVTVTHPDITRYFMTIPEAAELVIQAGSMGLGGDVFVLDMGQPVRILDLATKMIQLSGLTIRNEANPNGDIAIQFTGLRAGEKLYEELLIGDNVTGTEHPMIMRAHEDLLPWEEIRQLLQKLEKAARENDYATIRALLLKYVSGYKPQCDIVDLLYLER